MPRTGRPIVGSEPKNKQIGLRATESTIQKLEECSRITNKTKTDLLAELIGKLYDDLTKK